MLSGGTGQLSTLSTGEFPQVVDNPVGKLMSSVTDVVVTLRLLQRERDAYTVGRSFPVVASIPLDRGHWKG